MLALYAAIPEWVVAVVLLVAGWTFILTFRWQSRRGVIDYMPPLSLGVAVGLLTLALVYVWLAVEQDTALAVRGGAVRLALLILSVALALNNGGAVRMTWREWRARRKARRR